METNCPCCENHCPKDDLRCKEGRAHFGVPAPQNRPTGPRPAEDGDDAITLLRKCGHILHHRFGHGSDPAPLLGALTLEEQNTLCSLLTKCLYAWQPTEN